MDTRAIRDQEEKNPLPQKHLTKERTLGDGMDNLLLKLSESNLNQKDIKMNIQVNNIPTFKPIEPKSQIFHLIPKYVAKERKQPKYLTTKPREPKFIPYEPYKAAVEPIIPYEAESKKTLNPKASKNNVAIQDLVAQMSEMRMAELNKANKEAVQNEEILISKKQWEKEKSSYENDIKNLRETNSHLENQIKFQVQVNSELKTLLVAAVGEDLETRVQHLTEDKLQLARALLNSANHLTSHQEQTEWLSGQCEVWRSKFLASSLMVEELARWKSALSAKINELQEIVRNLLDEQYRVQKKSLKTCCYLQGTLQKLSADTENKYEKLKNATVLELSNVNCNISHHISELININKEECDNLFEQYLKMPKHTVSEKIAMKLLQNPVTVSNKQDAICNALMGTAMSLSGEQMYLKHPSNQATCSHCTGEIKNI